MINWETELACDVQPGWKRVYISYKLSFNDEQETSEQIKSLFPDLLHSLTTCGSVPTPPVLVLTVCISHIITILSWNNIQTVQRLLRRWNWSLIWLAWMQSGFTAQSAGRNVSSQRNYNRCHSLRTCHNFHIRMWREWWWSYRPEGCILTSAGVTPADISVFAETKKNYISGRKSGHLQLCLSAK